jgi:hypothetical protein
MTLVEELGRDLVTGNAVVVVGTGASVAISGDKRASWLGLLRSGIEYVEAHQVTEPSWSHGMAQALETSHEPDHFLAIAGALVARLGGPQSGEFGAWIRQNVGRLSPQHEELAKAIGDLGVPIITTNYDDLLEKCLNRDHVTWKQGPQFQLVLSGKSNEIGHLHGFWNEPGTIVLTDAQYRLLLADEQLSYLRSAMASINSLVYVGFGDGLNDPHFSHLRTWLREAFPAQQLRHWRLCRESELAQLQRDHENENITPISFGDSFQQLAPFLASLTPDRASVGGQLVTARSNGFEVLEEAVRQTSVLGPHIRNLDQSSIGDLLIPPVLMANSATGYIAGLRRDQTTKPERCDLAEEITKDRILLSGEEHVGVSSALLWLAGAIAKKRPELVSLQVDFRQLGSGPIPLRKQIVKQLRALGRSQREQDPLPPILLLLDNVHVNHELKLSRVAEELATEDLEVVLAGCRAGMESQILQAFDAAGSFALRYVGRLAKADVRSLAALVDVRRVDTFTSRAVDVVRAHRLPSTPFTFSMILSALIRGESLVAATSPTSLLDAYLDLLLGRGTPDDDSRFGLDAFNRSYILAKLAEHFVRERVGGIGAADAVQVLSDILDTLDWAEEPVSLIQDLEGRHVVSLKSGQLTFAQASYLHMFAARRALEDIEFLEVLQADPLYYAPILAHYSALKRTDVALLSGMSKLLAEYENEGLPQAPIFDSVNDQPREFTPAEIDASLRREISSTPSGEEDEYEPVNDSEEDLPPFPLQPVDQLPPMLRLALVLGLVSNVVRDTEIVTDQKFRREVLTRLLQTWARFVSMVSIPDSFEEEAREAGRALARELNVRDSRLEDFLGDVVEVLPLAIALGGISATLSSTKLVRTVKRSLEQPDWQEDPALSIFGLFMLYDVNARGWASALQSLGERHGSVAGVRSLVRRILFIAYVRQDLSPDDEREVLEFLAEQTLDLGNVRSAERADRRGRAIESLQRARLQARGKQQMHSGSILEPELD